MNSLSHGRAALRRIWIGLLWNDVFLAPILTMLDIRPACVTLDVIAPTRQLASAVLANLRQVLPSDELSVHPVAAAQAEPELIKAMRKAGAAKDAGAVA